MARLLQLKLSATSGSTDSRRATSSRWSCPSWPASDPISSVPIGVNDVVQGVAPSQYRFNVERILSDLIARVGAGHVVVVTTPDYTVTPAGAGFGDPANQSAGIRANNEIITELAAQRGIAVVDIFDLSLAAADDRSLVADDGLHPSGIQYARWVGRIEPIVERLIGGSAH